MSKLSIYNAEKVKLLWKREKILTVFDDNWVIINGFEHDQIKPKKKVKCDHRSKFSNLSNWKEEAWKKIRASTGFEPMTSAIPVRCSTNWAMKPHIGSKVNLLSSYLPVEWNDVKFIWNNSYLYCGCRWKWNVIIYNRSTNMNISYKLHIISLHGKIWTQ